MMLSKLRSPGASRDLVVKLSSSDETMRTLRSMAAPAKGRSAAAGDSPLQKLLASEALDSIEPLFRPKQKANVAPANRMIASVSEEAEGDVIAGINIVHMKKDVDPKEIEETAQVLSEDRSVEYAHTIKERHLMPARRRNWRRRSNVPLDPLEGDQWGLNAINLYRAQHLDGFEEATDVTIAVIDSGVDADHPDLQDVIVEERSFTSGPKRDVLGHGTHVIGIIAAEKHNEYGIAGVCQSRKIMSLKALGPYSGPGYYRAIRHATDEGANVINLSLGGEYDPTEELLITRAIENGVIVVAAMGNEFRIGNPTSYPAAIDGVIAVGASTKSDGRANFSNTGPHITLVAPGVDILSTVPTYPAELSESSDFDSWRGTSMATPFVSGAVALLLASEPDSTVEDITRALSRGADRVPGQRGFSEEFGHGRLNVKRALRKTMRFARVRGESVEEEAEYEEETAAHEELEEAEEN